MASCIGIILTGYLNDGTSGMNAIKRSGGTCIVQDTNQAEYPDMPLSVLESMEVDYCVPLNEIGETIKEITKKAEERIVVIQDDVLWEAEISEKVVTRIDAVAQIGETTIMHALIVVVDYGILKMIKTQDTVATSAILMPKRFSTQAVSNY